jgi:predicted kinase
LAKLLAAQLRAVYLGVDAIAIPLLRGSLTDDPPEAGRVAYLVAEELGRHNLVIGTSVVIDGLHATHESRAEWSTLAGVVGVPIAMVETALSDPGEHRRRVDERSAQLEGYLGPTWATIAAMAFEPWDEHCDGDRLVVDMTETDVGLGNALQHIATVRLPTPG